MPPIIKTFEEFYDGFFQGTFKYAMRLLGIALAWGLYLLVFVHAYAFFDVIAVVLKKRVGTQFGLVWCGIGLCLLYNILFNHFLAMTVKPGSPKDLVRIENLRKEKKNRSHKKDAKVRIGDGEDISTDDSETVEDDRFSGL
jgi:hypothetical protein